MTHAPHDAMMITRVYADDQGETHFEEIRLPLTDAGPIGHLSEALAVRSLIFRRNDADYNYDWHTAPARQYIVLLDGAIEIEVSDGEKRILQAGEIVLVEDVTGKGHRTRNLETKERKSLFIAI